MYTERVQLSVELWKGTGHLNSADLDSEATREVTKEAGAMEDLNLGDHHHLILGGEPGNLIEQRAMLFAIF